MSELFEIELGGYACGAVVDQECDSPIFYNRLGIKNDYFNSGVLMMNLNEWRKNDYCRKLISFVESNPQKCIYPDQDALNVVMSGKILYLDIKYNLQERLITQLFGCCFDTWRHPGLYAALSNAIIVHFCTSDKPWYTICRNPYFEEYQTYARKHPFIEYSIQNTENIIPRNKLQKYIADKKQGLKNDIISSILTRKTIYKRYIIVYKYLINMFVHRRSIKERIIDICICNCNRPVIGCLTKGILKLIHKFVNNRIITTSTSELK